MLNSILSVEASHLYQRLIDGEHILVVPCTKTDPGQSGSPAHELTTHGLADVSERGEPVLLAVEPSTAQGALLALIMSTIEQLHRQLTDSYSDFEQIQARFQAGKSSSDTDHIRLLTDTNEIILLSYRMITAASEEVVCFTTGEVEDLRPRVAVPEPVGPRKLARIRTVYTPDCIAVYGDALEKSIAAGEEARFATAVPTKMNVVGRSQAMVALDRTGLHATLYTRSRPLIDMLRLLFELVWEQATPYPATHGDDGLSPQEQRIISMLATGVKDEAIARQLDVTVRTVRRHITAAMTKLGADNRFAAGAMATKRGWV